ncbi:RNA polymerase II-associated protein [Epithele typhae]|uniref:RNA polymerase II-associated protein n=1 Tax=Epithele typhae TaxID=378194 RepID=UPI0020085346|nr:RNA polymerase II-associated protein [Epithele typhae]KAH9915268.1 RNA polymerase II-associated protein [Epithele typhae]
MGSGSDPLLLLQCSASTSSFPEATHLALSSSITVPKTAPTRLRRPGSTSTDPQSNPNDFVSTGAVYLAWLLRDVSVAEYMKQVRENGLPTGFVSVTERKNVVDWLEDKTQNLPNLVSAEPVSTTPPGTPPQVRGGAPLPTPSSSHRISESTSSALKRRYVADTADIEVVKKIKQNEIELQDRNTVLRGIKPNNFHSLKESFAERLKKLKEGSKGGASLSASSSGDLKMQPKKAKNYYPIIMISSSPTSLVTMHNVKKFLSEAVFEPSQDARARATSEGNARPEDMIPIYRKRTIIDSSGRETEIQARYFVVDSTEALAKFGPDAWDRVVCVMTTGQAWQFRPYKWTEPKALFHHVKGIYFTWTNDPQNTKIKDWNVTELKIDPHRRHVDKSVVAHFWRILDQWTSANKPSLVQG